MFKCNLGRLWSTTVDKQKWKKAEKFSKNIMVPEMAAPGLPLGFNLCQEALAFIGSYWAN